MRFPLFLHDPRRLRGVINFNMSTAVAGPKVVPDTEHGICFKCIHAIHAEAGIGIPIPDGDFAFGVAEIDFIWLPLDSCACEDFACAELGECALKDLKWLSIRR